jgi:hypothetical protein
MFSGGPAGLVVVLFRIGGLGGEVDLLDGELWLAILARVKKPRRFHGGKLCVCRHRIESSTKFSCLNILAHLAKAEPEAAMIPGSLAQEQAWRDECSRTASAVDDILQGRYLGRR